MFKVLKFEKDGRETIRQRKSKKGEELALPKGIKEDCRENLDLKEYKKLEINEKIKKRFKKQKFSQGLKIFPSEDDRRKSGKIKNENLKILLLRRIIITKWKLEWFLTNGHVKTKSNKK